MAGFNSEPWLHEVPQQLCGAGLFDFTVQRMSTAPSKESAPQKYRMQVSHGNLSQLFQGKKKFLSFLDFASRLSHCLFGFQNAVFFWRTAISRKDQNGLNLLCGLFMSRQFSWKSCDGMCCSGTNLSVRAHPSWRFWASAWIDGVFLQHLRNEQMTVRKYDSRNNWLLWSVKMSDKLSGIDWAITSFMKLKRDREVCGHESSLCVNLQTCEVVRQELDVDVDSWRRPLTVRTEDMS